MRLIISSLAPHFNSPIKSADGAPDNSDIFSSRLLHRQSKTHRSSIPSSLSSSISQRSIQCLPISDSSIAKLFAIDGIEIHISTVKSTEHRSIVNQDQTKTSIIELPNSKNEEPNDLYFNVPNDALPPDVPNDDHQSKLITKLPSSITPPHSHLSTEQFDSVLDSLSYSPHFAMTHSTPSPIVKYAETTESPVKHDDHLRNPNSDNLSNIPNSTNLNRNDFDSGHRNLDCIEFGVSGDSADGVVGINCGIGTDIEWSLFGIKNGDGQIKTIDESIEPCVNSRPLNMSHKRPTPTPKMKAAKRSKNYKKCAMTNSRGSQLTLTEMWRPKLP